jgi:hypothetical protein
METEYSVGFQILVVVVMNSFNFWDIRPCFQLKSIECSEEYVASAFSGGESAEEATCRQQALFTTCFMQASCLAYSSTLKIEAA